MNYVTANSISYRINGNSILSNISLELKQGVVIALLGPSGSGKTSLLRCLSSLEVPTDGVVEYNQDLYFADDSNLHHSLGFVSQEYPLFPHLNIRKNLLLPIKPEDMAKAISYLNELLDRLGLAELLDRYPDQISSGQKQRLAIVRALLLKPKVLLLDEFSSAQDVVNIKELSNILLGLKNEGVSIVFSTHLLGLARMLADEFCFLDAGEVIESGDIIEMRSPKTNRLKEFILFTDGLNT